MRRNRTKIEIKSITDSKEYQEAYLIPFSKKPKEVVDHAKEVLLYELGCLDYYSLYIIEAFDPEENDLYKKLLDVDYLGYGTIERNFKYKDKDYLAIIVVGD